MTVEGEIVVEVSCKKMPLVPLSISIKIQIFQPYIKQDNYGFVIFKFNYTAHPTVRDVILTLH